MKTLAVAFAALSLAAPAVVAPGPEAHPSCHCKAKVLKRGYWYRTVWRASDGTVLRVVCHVKQGTRCWIVGVG